MLTHNEAIKAAESLASSFPLANITLQNIPAAALSDWYRPGYPAGHVREFGNGSSVTAYTPAS